MGSPAIVAAARTPIGRRGGGLAEVHAAQALAHVQRAVLERAGVDPALVEQVIGGCVTAVGEQAFNVTRIAWLAGGLPITTGATTIDCQCGSSQQANHLVRDMIAAGSIDIGIACGVEMMSRVPMGANTAHGPGRVKPPGFSHDLPHQFDAAERIAAKYGITRDQADRFATTSQARAARAIAEGRFLREIAAPGSLATDEGPRSTSLESLAALTPLRPGGIHTAGNTCQISDGAAAILWMSEERAIALGLRPRARVLAHVLVGADTGLHIEGPIDATRAVLAKAGMTVGDIDVFEINEAFASVVLAWLTTFGVDRARVNPNGGAISLGHPMGATGARLITSALHELERTDRETALIAMCCGGAVATATVLARA